MTGSGFDDASGDTAGPGPYRRLKKRPDFVRAARGSRFHARAFSLQTARTAHEAPARIGLTVTRKTGSAVERNRIRRRLREALRLGAAQGARPGQDYVIVARRDALGQPFTGLTADLLRAFDKIRLPPPRDGASHSAGEA